MLSFSDLIAISLWALVVWELRWFLRRLWKRE
jgi:hypothetical protein